MLLLAAVTSARPLLSDDPPGDKDDGKPPQLAPPSKEELADRRIVFMKSALAHYTVQVGDSKEPAKVADPCLRFTNDLSGVTDGIISVYAVNGGRPAAVGQFFKNAPRSWVNEFTIIAENNVTIMRSGRPFWKPSEYVCKLTDLPGSPVPAAKSALRLAQMRSIATDFSVVDHFGSQEITKHNLRLLTQPVYRYSEAGKIVDGALFIFALGTNPECSLLLETFEDDKGARYRYALAPMSIFELEARHKETPVWAIERRIFFGNSCRSYYALTYGPDPGETVPE